MDWIEWHRIVQLSIVGVYLLEGRLVFVAVAQEGMEKGPQ